MAYDEDDARAAYDKVREVHAQGEAWALQRKWGSAAQAYMEAARLCMVELQRKLAAEKKEGGQ